MIQNIWGPPATLETASGVVEMLRLDRIAEAAGADLARLPHTVKILLESLARRAGSRDTSGEDVMALARWPARAPEARIAFLPARVLMQDFTGVPAIVDLAALRSSVARAGADPASVNPSIPVDLVVDHSVQVDRFGSPDAYQANIDWEYRRNAERYRLLGWAEKAFHRFRVVPPGLGICHQVNLEHLGRVVEVRDGTAFPDTVLGTDSHTTMINGLGILGWGVGGIEAEAAMLGIPAFLGWPEVVGVRTKGSLPPGTTATDLVLTLTSILRAWGVVGKFVEFFGSGLSSLTVEDRATLSNMSPEYGATASLFPVDSQTLAYLERTGRGRSADLVERYTKEQGLFRAGGDPDPSFSEVVELDLGKVEPSLAGPKRPQDRVSLGDVWESFQAAFGPQTPPPRGDGLGQGSVVISAVTSCTNTSNPSVMVGAGLLAKKAVEAGLRTKPWVKTSLAPGSRVVTRYLERAGLTEPLERLGFHLVGYGCTTCIGNSGPLPTDVAEAVEEGGLHVAAVLSGNRNFEGRIHPQVQASYLASPMLCIAYALAGRLDLDLSKDPIGTGPSGKPVMLADLWPASEEIAAVMGDSISPDQFEQEYAHIFEGDEHWARLSPPSGDLYPWDAASTYIQEPPFFALGEHRAPGSIRGARVLLMLGDSITTDHVSPAGSIKVSSPAGRFLSSRGVEPADFNSYGARRGNHEVMLRGTFANIRLRNRLAPGREGPWTTCPPGGEEMAIFDAARHYRAQSTPMLIIAGREYGSGSSRDWAAKGTALLGVKAVIAQSYERIHRSNLVGMGVLPLQFAEGESADSLGLDGRETYSIEGVEDLEPGTHLKVVAEREDGSKVAFEAACRIDSPADLEAFREGGILPMVLNRVLAQTAGGNGERGQS